MKRAKKIFFPVLNPPPVGKLYEVISAPSSKNP